MKVAVKVFFFMEAFMIAPVKSFVEVLLFFT